MFGLELVTATSIGIIAVELLRPGRSMKTAWNTCRWLMRLFQRIRRLRHASRCSSLLEEAQYSMDMRNFQIPNTFPASLTDIECHWYESTEEYCVQHEPVAGTAFPGWFIYIASTPRVI